MGYVIAAYAIAIGAVAIYAVRLARERRALLRALRCEPPAQPKRADFKASPGATENLG